MSRMILAKDKQGMNREFERNVNFLGDELSNIDTTHKIWKFKTCDDGSDTEAGDNYPKGGPVTGNFTIDVFFSLIKNKILRNKNEFRKTAGRRWSAWLNPK